MKFLLFCEMRTLQILFTKIERYCHRGVSAFNLAEFPTANGNLDFAIEILALVITVLKMKRVTAKRRIPIPNRFFVY